jgi:hypothetical protein
MNPRSVDTEMQLLRSGHADKHIAGNGHRNSTKKATQLDLQPVERAAAKRIISGKRSCGDLKGHSNEPDTVEPERLLAPLRPEAASDQVACPQHDIVSHMLRSRIARQQVVARQVRLAAKVRGIIEAGRAGLKGITLAPPQFAPAK